METNTSEFLSRFNRAFITQNYEFIENCLADDIEWYMVGDRKIKGKKEFIGFLKSMESHHKIVLDIENIIIQETSAAVNGWVTSTEESGYEKVFAFCDVYTLSEISNPRIKKLISFVLEEV